MSGKILRSFFQGLADGVVAPARSAIDAIWPEISPDDTNHLEEWEYQFGSWGSGTEAQRREIVDAAWRSTGGQSPRYLQDAIQASGFEVYYHGWREPGGTVRDPRDYTDQPLLGTWQCGMAEAVCGEPSSESTPECNAFLANDPHYLVNLPLNGEAPPPIPTDPLYWRHFIYWGGETFGDAASVPSTRLLELKRLLLRICPGHLWIVLITDEGAIFDDTFDETFN